MPVDTTDEIVFRGKEVRATALVAIRKLGYRLPLEAGEFRLGNLIVDVDKLELVFKKEKDVNSIQASKQS